MHTEKDPDFKYFTVPHSFLRHGITLQMKTADKITKELLENKGLRLFSFFK